VTAEKGRPFISGFHSVTIQHCNMVLKDNSFTPHNNLDLWPFHMS